jgi:hypothetical protein
MHRRLEAHASIDDVSATASVKACLSRNISSLESPSSRRIHPVTSETIRRYSSAD